jgi:hypothetical protein
MTAEVDANELRDAVERLHGCPAQLVEAVPVSGRLRAGRSGTASSISSTLRGIGRPTVATLGRRGLRGATSAASLLCSTRRQLPRLLMLFAPRSSRIPRLIGMAIKSALWRRLLAPAAGKRPHDREQPSINPDEDPAMAIWLGAHGIARGIHSAREQNDRGRKN